MDATKLRPCVRVLAVIKSDKRASGHRRDHYDKKRPSLTIRLCCERKPLTISFSEKADIYVRIVRCHDPQTVQNQIPEKLTGYGRRKSLLFVHPRTFKSGNGLFGYDCTHFQGIPFGHTPVLLRGYFCPVVRGHIFLEGLF